MNDLDAAAEKAELTGQICSFMVWLGEGRKLTQTGRIGLADARHLVELLGTGDRIDPEIGGRVFKTTSSEQLPHLTRIVEWMRAARLVRVTGTRLVPVKTNAALTSRPLDLVLALLRAYPRLGNSLFPRNTWRQSLVGDEFAEIGPALLTRLLVSQGPSRTDELKQAAFEEIAARYMLDQLSEQQMEMLRRTIDVDVTIAIAALGVLGVVVIGQDNETAQLTGLGRFAIRRLRGMAEPGDPVLQVRITLSYVDAPPVWRQVLIPAAYPLSRVHRVIQAAMGWEDCHLHAFQIGKTSYGPDPTVSSATPTRQRHAWPTWPGSGPGSATNTTSATAGSTSSSWRLAPWPRLTNLPSVYRGRRRLPAGGLRRPRRLRRPQRTPGRAAQRGTRRDAGVGG